MASDKERIKTEADRAIQSLEERLVNWRDFDSWTLEELGELYVALGEATDRMRLYRFMRHHPEDFKD